MEVAGEGGKTLKGGVWVKSLETRPIGNQAPTRPVSAEKGFFSGGGNMVLKIIGAVIVIWLAFSLIGFLFKAVGTLLIIAAVASLGVVAYGAIKGKMANKQIRR